MIRVRDRVVKVPSRPENVYFRDLFQPHLEGLNKTFILPLLAVKLVLLRVISLSLSVFAAQYVATRSKCIHVYGCHVIYLDASFELELC